MTRANGEAIRAIRAAKGLSLRGLAAAADIDPAHLHRVETGTRGASPRVLAALAAALEVTPEAISTGGAAA